MKKITNISLAMAVLFAVSCGESQTKNDENNQEVTTEAGTTSFTATEGDITKKDGVVLVYKNGNWVAVDNDINLGNGISVSKSGEVKKDGKTITIDDGAFINKAGAFFDKTGTAISNAWDNAKNAANNVAGDVKQEAGKAIDAIQEAAPKTVEAAKEGVQKGIDKIKEGTKKVNDATKAGVNAAKEELHKH